MSQPCFSFVQEPAYAGIAAPIVPVTLWFDEDRQQWRKQPRVAWDLATTDEATIEGWWQIWPDALPGIPLRLTNLCVLMLTLPMQWRR
jgi:hypothetical protein